MTAPVSIIAEAGVNHNGSLDMALELVDAAHAAGADIVKFQTFTADALVTRTAPMAPYQTENTGLAVSQYEMLKTLELGREAHLALMERCGKLGIGFLSTPFDLASFEYLTGTLGLATIKLGSSELTNAPLLVAAGRSRRSIILSTGMSDLAEVALAIGALAFGYADTGEQPSKAAFAAVRAAVIGDPGFRQSITIMHCTTAYPAPDDSLNLRAIGTLAAEFGLRVGYSDHTSGIGAAPLAVAAGACMLEKHITLDRSLPGPDHQASLEPGEFAAMVRAIRAAETLLGDGQKRPASCEMTNMHAARKSLFAARDVAAGTRFDATSIKIMRPGSGLSPFLYWEYLGKVARHDYREGDEIAEEP